MLVLITYMGIGFGFRKMKVLPEGTDVVISKLESFILVPGLIINNFMTRCTIGNLSGRINAISYSVLILGVSILLGYLCSPLLARSKMEKGIYRYSFAVANFGFIGNAVVKGVFGDDLLFDYIIYALVLNIFTYSVADIRRKEIFVQTIGKSDFSFAAYWCHNWSGADNGSGFCAESSVGSRFVFFADGNDSDRFCDCRF